MRNSLEAGRRPGNGGDLVKENLGSGVEIRLADLKRDVEAITHIFNQPKVIEHLSGFVPGTIRDFKNHIEDYIPPIPKFTPEGLKFLAENIVIATPDGIKAYYDAGSRNSEVYVAEVGGKVVGTATLQKPGIERSRCGFISKVAVSSDVPRVTDSSSRYGKGIGGSLIRAIHQRLFDGLGVYRIEATVIQDIEDYLAPMRLFEREGYVAFPYREERISLAWDNREGKLAYRDCIRFRRVSPALERIGYKTQL